MLASLSHETMLTGLLLTALLLAALAGGIIAHAVRVPRVIGYLLGGAITHALVLWLLADTADAMDAGEQARNWLGTLKAAEQPLKIVKSLALGLILFSIGGVFDARWMRGAWRVLWRLALSDATITSVLVTGTVLCAALFLIDLPAGAPIVPLALLLGIAAVATAPAATLVTLREYDAKGPVTDTLLGVVGANNVICIVLFDIAFLILAATGALGTTDVGWERAMIGMGLTTIGSVVVGVTLALTLSVAHSRLHAAEALLLAVAGLIGLWAARGLLLDELGVSFNFLLAALVAGAVFANIAVDPERFESTIALVAKPLFLAFFALAGYQMRFDEFGKLGAIGAGYIGARAVGKWLAARIGRRWAGPSAELRPDLGLGLMCQAAVVIGLADFVQTHWGDAWAKQTFVTTALGSVIVFELCGPILIRRLVVLAGEVKVVTLLRGGGKSGLAADIGRSIESLLRTLGARRKSTAAEPLRVRHIMRSNIKSLRGDASFDEVLRFVEQSRFSQFPVVDDEDRLIGVIHFSDIREIIYDTTLARLVTAADLCNTSRAVAPIDLPLDEALSEFQRADGNAMTVVDDVESRRVLGIVEQRDLLRALRR